MNDNRENRDRKNSPPPPSRFSGGFMWLIISVLLFIFLSTFFNNSGPSIRVIDYHEFIAYLEANRIERVEVRPDRLHIILLPDGMVREIISENEYGDYPIDYPTTATSYEGTDETTNQAEEETTEPQAITGAMTSNLPANFASRMAAQTANQQAARELQARTVHVGRMPDPYLLSRLDYHGVEHSAPIPTTNWLPIILMNLLPILLIVGLFFLMRRTLGGMMGGGKGGFMSFGQSNAKVYMEKKTGVTFADVAGQEEAKESLTEIVDFLHNPGKYTAIGAVQPKGALLVGPPGTGKTLFAKAVAGEAKVAFFSLSGSDFVEMFVGVGASRVRDLFKQAATNAPSIIFIDEIDAIGKSRDNQMSSNDEREQTLNQLLAEMDGFEASKGVVILGATNRPETLDKALLRPGRFDRRINVELPDLKGREEILRLHAKKVKMSPDVDLSRIAKITPGGAGADLANMINEAALNAVRMKRTQVEQEDLLEAVEVVIAGKEKKDRIMTEKEKRIVAFHEVGHALARAVQKDAKPVEKITIIPRTKGSLGYVLAAPEEERFIQTKEELLSEIVVCLAGRAAEDVEFNTQTTGASNDIEQATRMARSMVSMHGMSEKFGMMGLESTQNRYLDGRAVLNVSDRTGAELDEEVRRILDECYQKAVELLQGKRDKMQEIAEFLFNKETLTGDEFMEIYTREPKPASGLFDFGNI